uniref:Synembryn n=1 Tax=Electrophorus electricus TaxID=8005 RepID=A0A4W4GB59_ELEEL
MCSLTLHSCIFLPFISLPPSPSLPSFSHSSPPSPQRLAAALIWFVQSQLQPGVLRACLSTLRILSRDWQAQAPFITDSAILTLARLAGITCLPLPNEEEEVEVREGEGSCCGSSTSDGCTHRETDSNPGTRADSGTAAPNSNRALSESAPEVTPAGAAAPTGHPRGSCCSKPRVTPPDMRGRPGEVVIETCYERCQPSRYGKNHSGMLARGKRDARGESEEEGEACYDDGEASRKEAMKALCNVIYNSQRAQERASHIHYILNQSLSYMTNSQARGVSMLTAALGQCLEVRWAEGFEVVTDITAPPISKDATQRAMEILKSLFNVTYTSDRVDSKILMCEPCPFPDPGHSDRHTVNLLSVLPLACLDVLLSVRLSEESRVSHGVNMDSVHALLLFMERRLDRGHKLKEKLTPVLNLLTESCRAHRETRHYLKQQILPPLREVALRPEQGNALRNKLVRLMTHVDTDLKHCSAELLFVLCKENVSRFVKYTGFGNAAGLLAEQGFLWDHGPSSQIQYSSDSDSDTEEYRNVRDRINPVTGQVEEPQPNPMEGMSEEEKEAEASRLVNMFNMLSRHKIIQPMRVAADGRLVPLAQERAEHSGNTGTSSGVNSKHQNKQH